jgi:predicted permease
MNWPKQLFLRKQLYNDLDQEIALHLEERIEELVAGGMSVKEASATARREFGNVALVKETGREAWGWRWLEELLGDLRFGVRMLVKSPGFTAVAILTLAVGIGANTAVFSVVNGVIFNPLPYPHPEQLVTIHESKPNFATGSISFPNFLDWQKDNRTFSGMAMSRGNSFNLTGRGEAEQVRGRYITSDLFSVLGVNALIGRTFEPGEDRVGAAPTALISEGLWRRKFNTSSDAVGQSLTLDGNGYTIVGIIPASFKLTLGSFNNIDVYVPVGQWGNPILMHRDAGLGFHGIGRLKPGVALDQARADLASVTQNLAAAYPDTDKGIGAAIFPLKQDMVRNVSTLLLVLLGAVGFVLLISCVNVANLMLARSSARAREFAVRTALGASRGRILRQLLTESLLLSMIGGGLGLLLATWGTQAGLRRLPPGLPRAAEVGLDVRVLLFTLLTSLGCGILFGLVPALKGTRTNLHETLKEGGRAGSGARHRAQGALVVAETALALVLLISAGLMIRSLGALWKVNPGFDSHDVLTFGVALPPSMRTATAEGIRAALRNVDQQIRAVPGVKAASLSWAALPMGGDDEDLFWIEGQPKPTSDNEMKWALSYVVEEDYLQVMHIPLLRGRFFTAHDSEASGHVVVVDDIFAKQYFGKEDPIGHRIVLQNKGGTAEIVGIVGHVKQWGLDSDDTEQLRAQLYLPYMQLPDAAMQLSWNGTGVIVKYDPSAPAIGESIRAAVTGISGEHVMSQTQTMDDIIANSLNARRFSMTLFGVFAVLALGLAAVGIYGVVSYLVGERTQEIGIRVALGAHRFDVLRMVLAEGMKMTLVGVVIGVAAAVGLTHLMASLLFGVGERDPLTFASVAALLSLVALAACYLPARRATHVDPVVALRCE